ncbi:MAG: hypothetical protein ACSHYA_06700 [Opitutaceae bacterium]
MKRLSIILSTIYPVIVFVVLLGLLTQTAGIYLQFFTEALDGAALPVLTVFFVGGSKLKLILLGMAIVFPLVSAFLPKLIKESESLMLAYSFYHIALLALVCVILGSFMIALTLPLVETLTLTP